MSNPKNKTHHNTTTTTTRTKTKKQLYKKAHDAEEPEYVPAGMSCAVEVSHTQAGLSREHSLNSSSKEEVVKIKTHTAGISIHNINGSKIHVLIEHSP